MSLDPADRPIRVALVTNIPAPYRIPVWSQVARERDIALHVIFCSGREPDRQWDLAALDFPHEFLRPRFATVAGRYVHHNPDVWRALGRVAPQVVVTTGFNPTHLAAFAWARWHRAPHVPMTDGTQDSERVLGALHRALRRHVYARSEAFVGASEGSFDLYRRYGVRPSAMFKSHLAVDNAAFDTDATAPREVDLLFCGRFVELKQPLFALAVGRAAARRLGRRLRMSFVGGGPLEGALRAAAADASDDVDCRFPGFARQSELPAHYAAARLLLFPTLGDTWGVVANEACAAGVPVFTTPAAGVAGELVCDGINGRVLGLEVDAWAQAAAQLLDDEPLRLRMAGRGRELVAPYHHDHAAAGLAGAVRHAWRSRAPQWSPPGVPEAARPQRHAPTVVLAGAGPWQLRPGLVARLQDALAARGVRLAQAADAAAAAAAAPDLLVVAPVGLPRRSSPGVPLVVWDAPGVAGRDATRRRRAWWLVCDDEAAQRLVGHGVPRGRIFTLDIEDGEAARRLCAGLLFALRGEPAGPAPPAWSALQEAA